MKIVLLQVGSTDKEYIQNGIDEYRSRIGRLAKFETISIPDLRNRKSLAPLEQKRRESEMIMDRLAGGDEIILLDEKGKTFTSSGFAKLLNSLFIGSSKRIVFIIGGPYGFHENLYKKSDRQISLSSLTFSHQLVRLLFVEQLYRGLSILKGLPYHND